jgi:hypothetical protein
MKYFNVHNIREVLEYNKKYNILLYDTLLTFKNDATDAIQNRHIDRLKYCKTLKQRTSSSKLRWAELEQMAIEFSELPIETNDLN